jgi:mono/diheme cytochrome c family protein
LAVRHTEKGGIPFAGGRPFKLPFGTIYAPNLTPDKETGIGAWSDAEFLRAVHQGIGRRGEHLYPAFPYASYTMLADADVLAIKAYLFSLAPVRRPPIPNSFAFPFNQRWLMAVWAGLFSPDERFRPVAERSAQWNRGAYLVEAAGHCGECHSPRNLLQAQNMRAKFGGGVAEGWNAYNISADRNTGIGAWSAQDLAAYLARGHAHGRGTASGPMAEVVELSTSHLTSDDLAAMVAYLRTVPPVASADLPPRLAGPASARPREVQTANPVGKRIFEGNCVSCHAWSGAGALRAEAQLTGARSVNDPSAINVAQMILHGTGPQRGGRAYMPAFSVAYTDTEIAAAANYVTARFGSAPSTISARDVARLRSEN